MIFIYLSIFAIIGITIIAFVEYRKTGQSLLQILKKLCSIDSNRFENKLEKIHRYFLKKKKNITFFYIKIFYNIISYFSLRGKNIRAFIRKKLHPKTETSKISQFIQDIKEEK